jgi:hypothetical protein
MGTDVSVVIVSYNTRDLLRQCLRSVFASVYRPAEVFVVDNASADGSEAMVAAEFPDVTLVALDRNLGFGGANNVALQRCRGSVSSRSQRRLNPHREQRICTGDRRSNWQWSMEPISDLLRISSFVLRIFRAAGHTPCSVIVAGRVPAQGAHDPP